MRDTLYVTIQHSHLQFIASSPSSVRRHHSSSDSVPTHPNNLINKFCNHYSQVFFTLWMHALSNIGLVEVHEWPSLWGQIIHCYSACPLFLLGNEEYIKSLLKLQKKKKKIFNWSPLYICYSSFKELQEIYEITSNIMTTMTILAYYFVHLWAASVLYYRSYSFAW